MDFFTESRMEHFQIAKEFAENVFFKAKSLIKLDKVSGKNDKVNF
jgi:hypothetical protein